MRIKKAWIDYAEKHRACSLALSWLRKAPRTLRQLARYRVRGYTQGYYWLKYALEMRMLPKEARRAARKAFNEVEKELLG